jgi:uncharacterized protein
MRLMCRLLALAWLALSSTPLAAVPLWSVEHAEGQGTVLLLGSVHLLRERDQPLPGAVSEAYADAGRVLLELSPAELLDPAIFDAALARVGIASPGASAVDALGDEAWQRGVALARDVGFDLQAVAALEPWFVSLLLYSSTLMAAGFDPTLGVDQQVAEWALRDDRPAQGLETLDEQLRLFKDLEPALQREILLKTLEELPVLAQEAAELVSQWRRGDVEALAAVLEEDFSGHEQLRERIVAERNRAWLPEIEALTREPGRSLVVVGALHLVGPDGLPALLEARGLRVRRLQPP